MSSVTVVGNITRDPELRFAQSGKAVLNFSIAENRGQDQPASFYDVTAFDTLAENIASLAKGTRVIVFGRLQQDTWETDGQKRSKIKIIADEVGPSLRWATATVAKNARDAAPAGATAAPASSTFDDEEPF